MEKGERKSVNKTLPKSPTGIQGLDEITGGGLPTGRPTLICGSAGCGKTLLSMEFIVRGATQFNEPGVFMVFEETDKELIDENGFSVLPVTSLGLKSIALTERISSGIPELDKMLEGKGYYRGSTILISGAAGSGKTSVAAHLAEASCKRGERVLFFSFEESPGQIMRNMHSIGIELEPWIQKGLLQFHSTRPTLYGLEMHLTATHKAVNEFKLQVVICDPVNTFVAGDNETEVKTMLMRLVDFLKMKQITAFFTSLTAGGTSLERTDVAISSLIDTWLLLRDIEISGERNRCIYVLKSRGMAHSNQIREFILTDHGVELRDVYIGPGGFLTGSARITQEASENAVLRTRKNDIEQKTLQ